MKKIVFGCMIAAVIVSCQKDKQNANETVGRNADKLAARNLLANLKPAYIIRTNGSAASLAAVRTKLAKIGAVETGYTPQLHMVSATSSFGTADFVAKLKDLNVSVGVDLPIMAPDKMGVKELTGNNPPSTGNSNALFSRLWGMDAIDAPQAWNAGYLGEGAVVADLDEGFYIHHPDLAANLLLPKARNFVNLDDYFGPGTCTAYPECDPSDVSFKLTGFSHGTHTAGTIAAVDNNIGVIGVAPLAKIIPVKVLSDYAGFGLTSWIANAIVYAADQGVNVINMSLGGLELKGSGKGTAEDPSSQEVAEDIKLFNDAIQYAYDKGVLVVCSAGNSAIDFNHTGSLISMPAGSPHALSIAATGPYGIFYDPSTDLDIPTSYTNYGTSAIDFAAPGGGIDYPGDFFYYDFVLSTSGPTNYYWAAGTSMAAPHVSGVAALIYGKYPGIKPAQVEAILRKSADDLGKPGKDAFFGSGRVNAARAVQ